MTGLKKILGAGAIAALAIAVGSVFGYANFKDDQPRKEQYSPLSCQSPISEQEEIRRAEKFGYAYCAGAERT